MNIIKFDAHNSSTFTLMQPMIRMHISGSIVIGKGLKKILDLHEGEKVCIGQDQDSETGDWFLIVGDENGFPLKKSTDRDVISFSNAYIVKQVISSLDLENVISLGFLVDTTCTPCTDKSYTGGGTFYKIQLETAKVTHAEEPVSGLEGTMFPLRTKRKYTKKNKAKAG